MQGPQGPSGFPGNAGKQGLTGNPGIASITPGVDGNNGADGIDRNFYFKVNETIFIDSVYGDDNTGQIDNSSSAFKTIDGAYQGDEYFYLVYPGRYDSSIELSGSWFFENGVEIENLTLRDAKIRGFAIIKNLTLNGVCEIQAESIQKCVIDEGKSTLDVFSQIDQLENNGNTLVAAKTSKKLINNGEEMQANILRIVDNADLLINNESNLFLTSDFIRGNVANNSIIDNKIFLHLNLKRGNANGQNNIFNFFLNSSNKCQVRILDIDAFDSSIPSNFYFIRLINSSDSDVYIQNKNTANQFNLLLANSIINSNIILIKINILLSLYTCFTTSCKIKIIDYQDNINNNNNKINLFNSLNIFLILNKIVINSSLILILTQNLNCKIHRLISSINSTVNINNSNSESNLLFDFATTSAGNLVNIVSSKQINLTVKKLITGNSSLINYRSNVNINCGQLLGISRIHSDVFTVISNVNCQIYRFRKSISDFFNPFLLDRSGKIIFNLYLDLIENTRNTSVISIANNDSETILQGTINLAKTPSKLITKINNPNKYVTLAGNRWQANTIFEGNQVPTNFQVHRVQTTDTSFNNDQPLFATIEYLSSQANIFNSSSEIRCRITNAESLNSIIDITSDETRLFLEGRFVTTAENLITIDI